MTGSRNGEISHWMRSAGMTSATSEPLTGNHEFDVAIVGGGFTGLWTAHYLSVVAPQLRVAVLEANCVGYGASGRNGGWLSHLVAGNRGIYAKGTQGFQGAIDLQRAMVDSVEEVLKQTTALGIDMEAARGGNLVIGTTPAGMRRLEDRREADLRYGLDENEVQMLSSDQASARINTDGVLGGLYYPVVTRINPARLVSGLAQAVKRQGVRIFERSRVRRIEQGLATTEDGAVRATTILICTEGYGGPLLGPRRVIPINSSMIVTKPLSAADWARIGWTDRECLSDAAHTFIYSQRTADDRIAIGGRGVPYRFRSGTGGAGEIPAVTIAELAARLRRYFPRSRIAVDHGWSGVLGVTRDWCTNIGFAASRGIGWAYGYAGHGVTTANLAARTLVDLTLGHETPLTRLPHVGHRSPSWEPEPLRWLGVHGMYRFFRHADQWEERHGAQRTSALARIGSRLAGLHE